MVTQYFYFFTAEWQIERQIINKCGTSWFRKKCKWESDAGSADEELRQLSDDDLSMEQLKDPNKLEEFDSDQCISPKDAIDCVASTKCDLPTFQTFVDDFDEFEEYHPEFCTVIQVALALSRKQYCWWSVVATFTGLLVASF